MTYRVPFVDPKEHYRRYKSEIDHAITDTLANGDLVLRRQLREFEEHLAEFVGVRYAVGVNSCYHALYFSLVAAGVGAGDEVITVAHTFPATVSAIIHTGATPVLIDVAADYNMDVRLIESAVTARTKAILPVHLNGRVCEMTPIMAFAEKHNLIVIEDAAQAIGASYKGQRAGSFGLAGCFSFYPFKSLGGLGDGGAVTTNDAHVARMVTLLRFNGEDRETRAFHCHGQTALLDNVQAAVLDVKLRHLPDWIEHRRRVAATYREGLKEIGALRLPHFEQIDHFDSFQNYVVRTVPREEVRRLLTSQGIETLVHWSTPMWEHRGLGLQDPELPETTSISREVFSLPMSAETTEEHVEITVHALRAYFSERLLSAAPARVGHSA